MEERFSEVNSDNDDFIRGSLQKQLIKVVKKVLGQHLAHSQLAEKHVDPSHVKRLRFAKLSLDLLGQSFTATTVLLVNEDFNETFTASFSDLLVSTLYIHKQHIRQQVVQLRRVESMQLLRQLGQEGEKFAPQCNLLRQHLLESDQVLQQFRIHLFLRILSQENVLTRRYWRHLWLFKLLGLLCGGLSGEDARPSGSRLRHFLRSLSNRK